MASERFEVILADDVPGKQCHYRLRYKVFCVETGYEDPNTFPDQEEKDHWDPYASHFLVRERHSGQWVSAMRLVMPNPCSLPVATLARIKTELPLEQCAEISRLCLVGHYRRRLQGQALLISGEGEKTAHMELKYRHRTTEVLHVLLDAAVTHSQMHGIRYWFMLTTKSLARVCGQALSIRFNQMGPACLHRGERYPYWVNVDDIHITPAMGCPCYHSYSQLLSPLGKTVTAE